MKKVFFFVPFIFLSCKQEKNISASTIDEYLAGQAAHHQFNGNVLVAEKGKIVYQHSFGKADYESQRLLNDSSVFELASVTKQFTAMSVLLLNDKGKLKLTDSLRQYFPELPYSNITIRHMLTHTSGLPDYESAMNEKWDRSKIAFNKDVIAFLANEKVPADFLPGTKWEYSNTAYAILASIVEKVSGQTFGDFLSQNIFIPLGMTHTRIYNTRRSLKDTIANYAYGFVYNDSLRKYILPDNDPNKNFVYYLDGIQGDGCVNSTTTDLYKWDRALKNHTLLSESTQQEMLKGQELMDTTAKMYYGYGVMTGKNELGNMIAHSGGWPGYTTFLARYVDEDRTVIVLSNNQSASPSIAGALASIMAGLQVEMAHEHKEAKIDSASRAKFIGSYTEDGNPAFKIELKKDSLLFVGPRGYKWELKPESSSRLFMVDKRDWQFEIERDNKGNPLKYFSISYGVKKELKKN